MSELKLVPFERPRAKELIACLKEKLAEAERGELVSFVFACEHADGGNEHDAFIDDGASAYKLIGIVETMKAKLVTMVNR